MRSTPTGCPVLDHLLEPLSSLNRKQPDAKSPTDPAMTRYVLRRGPLYYVIVLYLMATTCWRTTPVGILAIALMCGGDGMADIVGECYTMRAPASHWNRSSPAQRKRSP